MRKEKRERNIQIYLDKFGFEQLGDTVPRRPGLTYRDLMYKYNLSLNALQRIVRRYREKYGPGKDFYKFNPPLKRQWSEVPSSE